MASCGVPLQSDIEAAYDDGIRFDESIPSSQGIEHSAPAHLILHSAVLWDACLQDSVEKWCF